MSKPKIKNFKWHCLNWNMRAAAGNEKAWLVGETRTQKQRPILCRRGYHAASSPAEAYNYVSGRIMCIVKLSGEIDYGDDGNDDKIVAQTCTLVEAIDLFAAVIDWDNASRKLTKHGRKERKARYLVPQIPVEADDLLARWQDGEALSIGQIEDVVDALQNIADEFNELAGKLSRESNDLVTIEDAPELLNDPVYDCRAFNKMVKAAFARKDKKYHIQ